MKKHINILMVGILFAFGAVFGVIAPPAKAAAAGECGASYKRIGSFPVTDVETDKRGGTVEVYWSEREGKNCAINRAHKNASKENPLYRNVAIRVARDANSTKGWDQDPGTWKYYAGPVYTENARNKCIDITAYTIWKNKPYVATKYGVHCD